MRTQERPESKLCRRRGNRRHERKWRLKEKEETENTLLWTEASKLHDGKVLLQRQLQEEIELNLTNKSKMEVKLLELRDEKEYLQRELQKQKELNLTNEKKTKDMQQKIQKLEKKSQMNAELAVRSLYQISVQSTITFSAYLIYGFSPEELQVR